MHEESPKAGRRRASDVMGGSAPAILIVDDDRDMRGYLRDCLRAVTARVVEAADGTEALAIVRREGPGAFDLIIADVVMPGLDGLSLRKTLSDEPALGAPAVLLVTGEVPRPGDEPVLRKPFNAGTLRERVDALLSRLS